jgi:hypothetical protein
VARLSVPAQLEKIRHINTRMSELVEMTQKALRGEGPFGAQEVRKIREPLTEIEPILRDSVELRQSEPELAAQIEVYKTYLLQLQKTVERLRVGLILQKVSLGTKRERVNATAKWCAAYHHTR